MKVMVKGRPGIHRNRMLLLPRKSYVSVIVIRNLQSTVTGQKHNPSHPLGPKAFVVQSALHWTSRIVPIVVLRLKQ